MTDNLRSRSRPRIPSFKISNEDSKKPKKAVRTLRRYPVDYFLLSVVMRLLFEIMRVLLIS
jgi:hypothetical protein